MNAHKPAQLRVPRAAPTAMGIGLLLTAGMLIALIVDQATVHSIANHVDALYAPFDLHPDPNVLFGIQYVIGAIGILLWLTTMRAVLRNKRGSRVVSSIVFLAAASLALLVLVVSEYGTQIFPPQWGVLGLLPSVAGLVAVIAMWTPRRVAL